MKKKQIRTIIIIAVVALFAGLAILRLDIEPADPLPSASPDLSVPTTTPDLQPEPKPSPSIENAENTGNPDQRPPAPSPSQQPEAEVPPVTPEPTPEQTPSPAPTPVPEQTPVPTPELPEETPLPVRHLCSIQIRCDTVVDTSKLENEAVIPFIPASGVILSLNEVEFTPGESVFDILARVCRENNIHMEFREEALYSGAYIEGINYLYEYDAGTLSGWMYKVNGLFPNYGCSKYTVNDGDAIVWCYTCDLGTDVGDNSTW